MKNRFMVSVLAASVILGSVSISGTVYASSSDSSEVAAEEASFTITDADGREVEINCAPGEVSRAVVINRYNLELIRATDNIDKVVGVDESIIENSIYWPEFSEENNFGNQQEPDFEVIAGMEPDVVLTPFVTDDILNALKPFGIPVVSLIGYNQDLDVQIDIVEQLFGENEKSVRFREFYHSIIDELKKVSETIPEEEKKTAIWESIADYSIATGGNAWVEMMTVCGVEDPFADVDLTNSTIDAEALIEANADVMFKMVAASGMDLSGYTAPSDEDYKAAAEAYLARPGFGAVTAVENGDVYFVTSFCFGGMGKLIGSAYIAKTVYPEYYEELDPDAVFGTWMQEFQNIDPVSGHCRRLGDIVNE